MKHLREQQKRQTQRKVIFKRAEQYVKEYVAKEKDEIRLKREARKSGDFYVEAEPKVLVVVRSVLNNLRATHIAFTC